MFTNATYPQCLDPESQPEQDKSDYPPPATTSGPTSGAPIHHQDYVRTDMNGHGPSAAAFKRYHLIL